MFRLLLSLAVLAALCANPPNVHSKPGGHDEFWLGFRGASSPQSQLSDIVPCRYRPVEASCRFIHHVTESHSWFSLPILLAVPVTLLVLSLLVISVSVLGYATGSLLTTLVVNIRVKYAAGTLIYCCISRMIVMNSNIHHYRYYPLLQSCMDND